MKKFKNYDEVKAYREKERLPRGAYILKIMNVEEVTNSYGESLVFSFDIAEGEHKGFYQQEYNNQSYPHLSSLLHSLLQSHISNSFR